MSRRTFPITTNNHMCVPEWNRGIGEPCSSGGECASTICNYEYFFCDTLYSTFSTPSYSTPSTNDNPTNTPVDYEAEDLDESDPNGEVNDRQIFHSTGGEPEIFSVPVGVQIVQCALEVQGGKSVKIDR